jgi:small subunit ribosomal protein S6
MSETRQYELVYVVSPETDEDGVAGLHTQIAEIVEKQGGRLDKTDNWGRRQLAYEIDRHREGTYVLELISGSGEIVSEIDRRLRVSDNVLRHLVVRVDEDLRKAQRTRERRQSRVQRRRAARGQPPVNQPPGESAETTPAAEAEAEAGTGAGAPQGEADTASETTATEEAAPAPQAEPGGEVEPAPAGEAAAEPEAAAAGREAAESEVES